MSSEQQPRRSILTRLRDGVRGFTLGPFFSSAHDPWWRFGQGPVSSGVAVTLETSLGVSAFFCAVSTISQDIASLPLFLYKGSADGGKTRFDAHPLNRLLHDQPNPETTSFQWRAAMMVNALTGGNAYSEIQRDGGGRPIALWHLTPHRVTVLRQNGALVYRVTNGAGSDTFIDASDMLHIKGPSPDGILGYDIVHLGREALGLSIAAERFGATFFSNGSQPGGVLTIPGGLTEQARKNLREALEARHQGSDRAHKWLIAENGATFNPIGVNPRDSQFNELRVHQIREVARFFKIPVAYLGDLERATYSNFEQMQLTYYTTGLRPWLVSIEQELDSKLIAPSERNIQHFEHVAEGFLRADTEKRAQFYTSMITNGIMSINEVRSRENLPPVPGGDIARVPMNMEPLGAAPVSPARVAPRADALLVAQRDLLIDAFYRVIRREVDRARQQTASPEKLRVWANDFYTLHTEWSRSALLPAFRAWAICLGADAEAIERTLDAQIAAHVRKSRLEIQRLVDVETATTLPAALERLMVRWERERATTTVDHMLQHGLTMTSPAEEMVTPSRSIKVQDALQMTKMQVKQSRVEIELEKAKPLTAADFEALAQTLSPALAQKARQVRDAMELNGRH
jgi:HK97 family phage portal protein